MSTKTQSLPAIQVSVVRAASRPWSLCRVPQVVDRVGKSTSSVYQDVADGLFPPPVKIGVRAAAWPDHEVDAIVRARVAGRSDSEIRELVRRLVTERADADR